MPANILHLPHFSSCNALLDAHLEELQKRFGMTTWMITRLVGDELVILRLKDRHYRLHRGYRLNWRQNYCGEVPSLTHDAALISFLLNNAVREAREKRLTTFVEHPDRCDDTGLPGRKGWDDICRQEASNCRDFGLQASVLYLQAPEDGDSLTIADSLAALLREQDSIAHLGDNRFGIMLADTDETKSHRVADRIRDALNAKQLLVRIDRERLVSG